MIKKKVDQTIANQLMLIKKKIRHGGGGGVRRIWLRGFVLMYNYDDIYMTG